MPRTRSLTGSFLTIAASAAALSLLAPRATGQHLPYSTHDWQLPSANLWSEAWADVKTPGDGRTYAVGTTRVDHTQPDILNPPGWTVQFSGAPCQGPSGWGDAPNKIVVILQVTDDQGIVWQRFLHGDGGLGLEDLVFPTHARGVSVFPGPTPAETRIAICGETFCRRMPQGQATWSQSQHLTTAGFVAVYNGGGTLLWSHLFYGNDGFASTAIADVGIHVDTRGSEPVDVVTYCGLSTNGVFDPSLGITPLTPRNEFLAIAGTPPCANDSYPAGSAANHPHVSGVPDLTLHSNQWDGIVGRLVRDHVNPAAVSTNHQFHAILGGYGDDGLFGMAERDLDTFAVVGTTKSGLQSSVASDVYPFTRPKWTGSDLCLNGGTGIYCHGVITEIQVTSPTTNPGVMLVLGSTLIGGPGASTVARDVIWHGGQYYVVGSTTDQTFWSAVPGIEPGTWPTTVLSSTGYLVGTEAPNQGFVHAEYWPRFHTRASAVLAVSAWNEYDDHLSVLGWVEDLDAQGVPVRDLVVSTYFRDTTVWPLPLPSPFRHLTSMREHRIVAPGDETSAAIDSHQAIFANGLFGLVGGSSPAFDYQQLQSFGDDGGGGLGVDSRGRSTVVGSTKGAIGYPATAAGRPAQIGHGQNDFDGVISVVDMLPAGACRSDGTGQCPVAWSPAGPGGTTPACALSSFGSVLGTTLVLKRMYLDFQGVLGPTEPVSLVVDRPPPSSWVVLSVWHFGITGATASPSNIPFHEPNHGVDIWFVEDTTTTPATPASPLLGALVPTGASLRDSWPPLPAGYTYMAQYLCWLVSPLVGTSCTAPDLTWAATPAIIFGF